MKDYISRDITPAIQDARKYFQVIVITGPRQSGKSTLCKFIFEDFQYYNLEDLALREKIRLDPKAFLATCGKEIVIDEAQHCPELMSYIQIIVDSDPERLFVLTGSSNFGLLQSVTQSLAGRAALFTLLPLSILELKEYAETTSTNELMFNGFYPALFTKHIPPTTYYANYNATYVERDVRQITELRNQDRFVNFMRLCALRIGSELNKADIAKCVGVSATTIGDWLSILKASYVLFTLQPYYANLSKRLTKTPKIYFYDTGLASYLIGLRDPSQIEISGMKGALFENMAVLELMKKDYNAGLDPRLMFYRENSGKEVDVICDRGFAMDLYEVKASSTFRSEYMSNLKYVAGLFTDKVLTSTLIYDGDPMPPTILNIRDI